MVNSSHWWIRGLCIIVVIGIMFIIPRNSRAQDAAATINVQADKPGNDISPVLNGIFFEDINFAGDGGLYPERIKNGSFEFQDPMMGWKRSPIERGGAVGGFGVVSDRPLNGNNPHFLRAYIEQPGEGLLINNEGFRGLGVRQGAKFTFSVYARSDATQPMSVTAQLFTANNRSLSEPQTLSGFTSDWKKYSCTIEANATEPRGRIAITIKGVGTLDLDMVSLFPQDTFNNHGLRTDLVQLLKDLHPAFMRFPGGCIVEGRTLEQRYQWKTTIGDLAQRKEIMNRWNVEFPAPRNAPDYYESFGLGFYEFFQLCEDIGAKPLPILNCGMSCQFNLAELAPMKDLDPYVQDALDLIEFANGPATSTWGAKRAAMGHPEPFGLTMMGIGNEQWGPQYIERYERFSKAIKGKYPQIKLVSAVGPEPADSPGDTRFSDAWTALRKLNADLIDEHFYKSPFWFYSMVHRYDNYDRNGPKVFAGEFAAHIPVKKDGPHSNTWDAALAEAALMTGLEHNGDVVQLASYAPLFAHVDAWQWNPNLIWFDNLRSFGTVNYYVQQAFSMNRGAKILPYSMEGSSDQLFCCASTSADGGIILKVVNSQPSERKVKIHLAGANGLASSATVLTMASDNLAMENSLDDPRKLTPAASKIDNVKADFEYPFAGYSLTIIRIPKN